jgi:hypothetical protein
MMFRSMDSIIRQPLGDHQASEVLAWSQIKMEK